MDTHCTATESILVTRRPIFDRRRALWGYVLRFSACGEDVCDQLDAPGAVRNDLIVDGLPLALRGLPPGKHLCLKAGFQSALKQSNHFLPPESVVLEIPSAELVGAAPERIRHLQQGGYRVAADNYAPSAEWDDILHLLDVVTIDFAAHDPGAILKIREQLQDSAAILAASNLKSWDQFEGAKALGFQLFHGTFFAEPEILRDRKVPTHRATRVRLLRTLTAPDTDPADIVDIIAADPPLAFRLLQFVNSPAFGFTARVDSLQRAVALLGLKPLKNWAMLVLLSDMDSSDRGHELSWQALQRGIFLQQAAEKGLTGSLPANQLFLLGLFSNVDALMGLPMPEALERLSLCETLQAALERGDGPLAPWLNLLRGMDSGGAAELRGRLASLGFPAHLAADLYMRSSRLAAEALGDPASEA